MVEFFLLPAHSPDGKIVNEAPAAREVFRKVFRFIILGQKNNLEGWLYARLPDDFNRIDTGGLYLETKEARRFPARFG